MGQNLAGFDAVMKDTYRKGGRSMMAQNNGTANQYARQTLSRMGMKKKSGPPMMSTGAKMAPKMSEPDMMAPTNSSIQKSMSTALGRGRRNNMSRRPVSGYGPSYA